MLIAIITVAVGTDERSAVAIDPPTQRLLQASRARCEAFAARAQRRFQDGAMFRFGGTLVALGPLLQQPRQFVVQIADQERRHGRALSLALAGVKRSRRKSPGQRSLGEKGPIWNPTIAFSV